MTFKYDSPELCWLLFLLVSTTLEIWGLFPKSFILYYCMIDSSQKVEKWREKEQMGCTGSLLWGPHSSGQRAGVPSCRMLWATWGSESCEYPDVYIQAVDCLELGLGENRGKIWYLSSLQRHFEISVPSTICFPASSEKCLIHSFHSTYIHESKVKEKNSYSISTASMIAYYLFVQKKIVILRSLFQLKINQGIWN